MARVAWLVVLVAMTGCGVAPECMVTNRVHAAVGSPCEVNGGIDACAIGAYCFSPRGGAQVGLCVQACSGSSPVIVCPDDGTVCRTIGASQFCVHDCMTAGDCPTGQACDANRGCVAACG